MNSDAKSELLSFFSKLESAIRAKLRDNEELISSLSYIRDPMPSQAEKMVKAATVYADLGRVTASPDAWMELDDYPIYPLEAGAPENRMSQAVAIAAHNLKLPKGRFKVSMAGLVLGAGGVFHPGTDTIFLSGTLNIDDAIYGFFHEAVHIEQHISGKWEQWGHDLAPVEERDKAEHYEDDLKNLDAAYFWSKVEVDARKRGEKMYQDFVDFYGGTPIKDLQVFQKPVQ